MSDQHQLESIARGGPATESVNVLCVDGGGVRGLSSLLILQDLFQRLSIKYSLPKWTRPCDVFDIICGTSTGGIIALMLGLRMIVDKAIDAYLECSRTVFGGERATEHPIYDASKLEEWMKKVVSRRTGDKRASLADPQGCRTFVVAVRRAHDEPTLMRLQKSFGLMQQMESLQTIVRFGKRPGLPLRPSLSLSQLVLGGELSRANNPSQLAIEEVENVFPSREITCFQSLGTGKPGDVVYIPENERGIADACEKILKSCEIVHDETFKVFERRLGGGYVRLSVDRGLGKFKLDEWNESDLADITDGYLANSEVKREVTKCIEILKESAQMIVEDRLM